MTQCRNRNARHRMPDDDKVTQIQLMNFFDQTLDVIRICYFRLWLSDSLLCIFKEITGEYFSHLTGGFQMGNNPIPTPGAVSPAMN